MAKRLGIERPPVFVTRQLTGWPPTGHPCRRSGGRSRQHVLAVAGGAILRLLSDGLLGLIMNRNHCKTGRNIPVAAVMYAPASFFNEICATRPDGKIIRTGLLIALVVILIACELRFFVNRTVEGRGLAIGA